MALNTRNLFFLRHRTAGFTLVELMIVLGVIAIILTLALPAYTDYTIRAKIGEALGVAAAAKTAVTSTCHEDPTLTGLTNSKAGYGFTDSTWVQDITISGSCLTPVITMATQNTGTSPDPSLTLTGTFTLGAGVVTWICASNGPNHLLPSTCRS